MDVFRALSAPTLRALGVPLTQRTHAIQTMEGATQMLSAIQCRIIVEVAHAAKGMKEMEPLAQKSGMSLQHQLLLHRRARQCSAPSLHRTAQLKTDSLIADATLDTFPSEAGELHASILMSVELSVSTHVPEGDEAFV